MDDGTALGVGKELVRPPLSEALGVVADAIVFYAGHLRAQHLGDRGYYALACGVGKQILTRQDVANLVLLQREDIGAPTEQLLYRPIDVLQRLEVEQAKVELVELVDVRLVVDDATVRQVGKAPHLREPLVAGRSDSVAKQHGLARYGVTNLVALYAVAVRDAVEERSVNNRGLRGALILTIYTPLMISQSDAIRLAGLIPQVRQSRRRLGFENDCLSGPRNGPLRLDARPAVGAHAVGGKRGNSRTLLGSEDDELRVPARRDIPPHLVY